MMKRMMALAVLTAAVPLAAQTDDSGPIEVPVHIEDGRLMVPVEGPDGTTYHFMLTTSTPTVLSESTAAKLGASPGLTLGGVEVRTDGMQTLPDDRLTVGGKPLAGMVGPGTLNQFDVLIDAPGGRLVMKPVGRRVAWEGMELTRPVRVRVLHGMLIAFDTELSGRATMATMDITMSALMVNAPVTKDLGIADEGAADLTIGGSTQKALPVKLSDHPAFPRWDPEDAGFVMVGAPAVADCALSISWVHQEIRTCVR